MRFDALLLAISCLSLTATSVSAPAQAQPASAKQTLYYIPHTHWEGAVFYTREEYLQFGLSNLLSAIRLMEKYPEYTFALDQVAYFKPLLERYPEEAATVRKLIKQGRLEIVGGMDVMPDDVKVGGEVFVRQMQYGKQYCREKLGLDVDVAWLLDTFGHHPQMPQLLKLAGFKSFYFCRGVPKDEIPSEFNWRGIDGSTIPAIWVPGFYGLFYGPPRDQGGFDRFFVDRFNALNIHTTAMERVGLAGVDVSEPEDYVTPLLRNFNKEKDKSFTIHYAVPSEFAKLVAKRKNTPTISGDFNPIFQGTYSSRIELKQATKEIEQKLVNAEALGAISNWLGKHTDDEMLWRAWEPVLFNQTHDLASGTMADHVYQDTVHSYEFSKRLAEEMVSDRWKTLSDHIDTRGEGIPVIVCNTLGMPRSEVVEADLGFSSTDTHDVSIIGPDGKTIPCQYSATERYSDGALRRAKATFLAKDVPALGYALYRAIPASSASSSPGSVTENVLENEFFRLTIDLKTGAILSIIDKESGLETLSAPANVVSRQVDKGDLWELYHTLDGGSYIAETEKQPVPTSATALLSNASSDKKGSVIHGEVYDEANISHPFGSGSFATRIRVAKGVRRIDIETTLVNEEKQVRYQVLFPSAIKGGVYTQEIPYGSVQRAVGIENPAQTWVDYNDGRNGMALLNCGLPGNLVSDGTLMLSLMRSQSLGDYNLGHTSDSGYELSMPHTFRYSLIPYQGDWKKLGVYRGGQSINNPMLVSKSEHHAGRLPQRWGMVQISQRNVQMTCYKPGPKGSTILRVYEAAGKTTNGVKVTFATHVQAANEANLLEDTGAKLSVDGNTITFDMHPYEIKTIKLKF